jgi:hypothetical protein
MNDDMEIAGVVILCCVVCIILIILGGCSTRKSPGEWDANLRYTLTHPECQITTNIFGNC